MQRNLIHTSRRWHSGGKRINPLRRCCWRKGFRHSQSLKEARCSGFAVPRGWAFSEGFQPKRVPACSTKCMSKPKNTPSKTVTSHGSPFDSKVVTHRNVMPELFRCPSPRWAPFHRLSTAGNLCHLPAIATTVPTLSQLLEWTGFILPLPLSIMMGKWKIDILLIITWASVQPEDIGRGGGGNEVVWLVEMTRSSICVCCKLIGTRLQVSHD